jgi:NAD(P)-dependent dehydrogenase (short-subunit alcohol dehydrogenase family)
VTGRVPSAATYTTPRNAGSASSLRGRVVVVTGATRGIGRAAATRLAQLGAEVVIVGRDEGRLLEARTDIAARTRNERIAAVRADFASLDSVRRGASEIVERWRTIHVLINNAGINSAKRTASADGYELTFAVNCLAPFLLTSMLAQSLLRADAARIVNVASVFAHLGRIRVEDLMFERKRYEATNAYTQSKLAGMMLALGFAERLLGTHVTVNDVYPGLVATDLLREHWYSAPFIRPLWSGFLLTPEQAGQRLVHAATSPALTGVSGKAFAGTDAPARTPWRARDADVRRLVWNTCVRLTGAPDIAVPQARR